MAEKAVRKTTAILLATYNGAAYLLPMLESLEAQTDRDWICCIHDDGSADGTDSLLREWVKSHGTDTGRYRLIPGEPTGGAAENFFFLLSQVEADDYLFADQDDVWLPEKIAKTRTCLEALEAAAAREAEGITPGGSGTDTSAETAEHTGEKTGGETVCGAGCRMPLAVFSDMTVTNDKLEPISDSFIRHIGRDSSRTTCTELLIDNPAAGCTMMFTRALRDRALAATSPEDLRDIEMHDGWLLLLASIYGKVACVDEPLVYYRQHGANEMGAVSETRLQKILRNAGDLASGRFAAEKRRFHQREKRLAAILLKQPDLPAEVRKTLTELTQLDARGKLYRMRWYKKHGLTRAKHDFWMRLWV